MSLKANDKRSANARNESSLCPPPHVRQQPTLRSGASKLYIISKQLNWISWKEHTKPQLNQQLDAEWESRRELPLGFDQNMTITPVVCLCTGSACDEEQAL